MVPFSILITDDKKKENNETFHLVIDPYSLPNGVVVGTPNKATITIVDNTKGKIMLYYSYSCLFPMTLCQLNVQLSITKYPHQE